MIYSLLKYLSALFLLLFAAGCLEDVPHDNPLDPQNSNRGYTLSGTVNTLYAPVQTISNAIITLEPGNEKVFSRSDGSFLLENLLPGDYTVYCTADGYTRDSLRVTLNANHVVNFFLDGLPYFETISLTTQHLSQFFPVEDLYYLQIEARVNDPDGIADINSVFFDIPEYNVHDTLFVSLEAGTFSRRLSIDDLPVNTIQSLIGRAFILSVLDDAGKTVKSGKRYLTRVIEETPVLNQPVNLQTVPVDSIRFIWQKVRLPYWFNLKIEIFQINQGLLSPVTTIPDIPGATQTLTISNTLPAANYVWILKVTDEFGNSSSSREGTFQVTN